MESPTRSTSPGDPHEDVKVIDEELSEEVTAAANEDVHKEIGDDEQIVEENEGKRRRPSIELEKSAANEPSVPAVVASTAPFLDPRIPPLSLGSLDHNREVF